MHCRRPTRSKLLSKWAAVVEVVRININLEEESVALCLDSWERRGRALKKRKLCSCAHSTAAVGVPGQHEWMVKIKEIQVAWLKRQIIT